MTGLVRLERFAARTPRLEADLAIVMAECADYYRVVHGRDADARDLDEFLDVAVPGIPASDIHAYGLFDDDRLVGFAGLILGWKRPGQSMIGILAVSAAHRGRGIGRAAVAALERIARASPHGGSMRIGIVETNGPAFGFWHALGFLETGERRALEGYSGEVVLLEKALDGA